MYIHTSQHLSLVAMDLANKHKQVVKSRSNAVDSSGVEDAATITALTTTAQAVPIYEQLCFIFTIKIAGPLHFQLSSCKPG